MVENSRLFAQCTVRPLSPCVRWAGSRGYGWVGGWVVVALRPLQGIRRISRRLSGLCCGTTGAPSPGIELGDMQQRARTTCPTRSPCQPCPGGALDGRSATPDARGLGPPSLLHRFGPPAHATRSVDRKPPVGDTVVPGRRVENVSSNSQATGRPDGGVLLRGGGRRIQAFA